MAKDDFSFLITTDTHLGFKENDPIRDRDSFVAFEEALHLAAEKNVDFILLGGDLFHVNRPSLSAITRCSEIIRKYSLAYDHNRPSFKIVGGDLSHSDDLKQANFECYSFNVRFPIFTVHGNHDDPTGPGPLSVCQSLATNGLLNYFGNCDSSKEIRIKPLILKKGNITIALYGLGFIPDQKLKFMWNNKQVTFQEPPPNSFSILVLHQNRVCHEKWKHIPDELAPEFFNLIIRGHEHDALEPETISETKIVYQPGSTVATSMTRGEAIPKKVAIFKIHSKKSSGPMPYKLVHELYKLESCRIMYVKDLAHKTVQRYVDKRMEKVKTSTPPMIAEFIKDLVVEETNKLLEEFKKIPVHENMKFQMPTRPLIRIRVEYINKEHRFNELEVSREFCPSQVANQDIVLFMKSKVSVREGKEVNTTFEELESQDPDDVGEEFEFQDGIDINEMKKTSIDSIIRSYFDDKPESEKLQTLTAESFSQIIKELNDRGDVISKEMVRVGDDLKRKLTAALISEEHAKLCFGDEDQVKQWISNILEEKRAKLSNDPYSGDY